MCLKIKTNCEQKIKNTKIRTILVMLPGPHRINIEISDVKQNLPKDGAVDKRCL